MKINIALSFFLSFFILFLSCETTKTTLTQEQEKEYLKKGQTLALQTFGVLGGQLQKALKEGGVEHAIGYCNTAAYPLVDSLSKANQANIKRTSLQLRNPKNKANASELNVLKTYEAQVKSGTAVQPIVQQEGASIAFYAPIKLNALCLQCHGKIGAELSEENLSIIQKYYPEDKATGYSDGDLRGIWSIRFPVE